MNNIYLDTRDLPQWLIEKHFWDKDYYSIDELIGIIEDLDADVERLKEKFEDFKKDVESNYKFMPTKEQIGYDERW